VAAPACAAVLARAAQRAFHRSRVRPCRSRRRRPGRGPLRRDDRHRRGRPRLSRRRCGCLGWRRKRGQ
jgi:hypothetical protein